MELAYKKENIFLHKFMPCLLFFMFAVMCLFGSYVQADNSIPLVFINYSNNNYLTDTGYSLSGYVPSFQGSEDSYVIFIGSYTGGDYHNWDNSNSIDFYCMYYDSSLYNLVQRISSNDSNATDVCLYYLNTSNYSSINSIVPCSSIRLEKLSSSFNDQTSSFVVSSVSSVTQTSYGTYATFCKGSFFHSTNDILRPDGTVVFQAPPQQVEALGILAEKTQGVEMDKTLQEITGILPVILVVIVGLIAIRKAILFLTARMKRV